MTDAQFGMLTTAFLWFYAAASPFGGFMADRFSRRLVLIISVALWSSITIVTSQVESFEPFLILRALLGLSQAFYIPAAVALIVDFHRGPTRAFAGGIHLTGLVFGSMIGGLGGWLAELHGWSNAYLYIGIPNLAMVLVLYFFLRDPPREQRGPEIAGGAAEKIRLWEALWSLVRTGPFFCLLLAQAVQGGVSWIIIGWIPTMMREQFAMAQSTAGFSSLGLLYGFQITGLLIGGFWSDRWSRDNPRARIIIPAIAIMISAPVVIATAWFPSISLTLVGLAMYGLAMGFLGANNMPIVCLIVDTRYRATAVGVMNCCTAISGGFAVYGVGAMRDANVSVSAIIIMTAVGVFVCGFLLWLVNVWLKKNDEAVRQSTPA